MSAALSLGVSFLPSAIADEQVFGNTRGAETLPKGHFDVYETLTMRTGKAEGHYRGFDAETEIEYGISDRLQTGIAVEGHYFDIHGVDGDRDGLDDKNGAAFGGISNSWKYCLASPFKEDIGIALRWEMGYKIHDDVAGLEQDMIYFKPEIMLQKNYLDDTLITVLNLGLQEAWGKKPAEEYDNEISFLQSAGVSYRFMPNWFIGLEERTVVECPYLTTGNRYAYEHSAMFAGPALHYGSESWWCTLSWSQQIYGDGVDEGPNSHLSYAEETKNEFRFKVGFNF
jgi:hypothetical protein